MRYRMSNNPENTLSSDQAADIISSNSVSFPESISLDKWADSGFEWQGEIVSVSFERLATLLSTEREQQNIELSTQLYRQNNVLHLSFKLVGEVWLTCQRCLQPVLIDLTDDYDIALLNDESQIRLIDDEQDHLLLDEIITEQTPERLLPLKKLVEDEILLKVPMAPKHDDCEMAITQFGEIPEEEENENPFAALAALKGKL